MTCLVYGVERDFWRSMTGDRINPVVCKALEINEIEAAPERVGVDPLPERINPARFQVQAWIPNQVWDRRSSWVKVARTAKRTGKNIIRAFGVIGAAICSRLTGDGIVGIFKQR